MTNKSTKDEPSGGDTLKVETRDVGSIFLHVICVYFHHRNGPQLEYVYPPFPRCDLNESTSEIDNNFDVSNIPKEWKMLPFICLPDGVHAHREEFVYFHLKPVKAWGKPYSETTLFGLSCCRSIPTNLVLNKTADMTRSMIQKSVAIISCHPILGYVQPKLGVVTEAFFNQRDFSNVEILQKLYMSLNHSLRNERMENLFHTGFQISPLVRSFNTGVLKLFKLMFLEKKVVFFGQEAEKISSFQYALLSLFPKAFACMYKSLTCTPSKDPESEDVSNEETYNNMGIPLALFREDSIFQPYIPLQQMSELSSSISAFLVGTSNKLIADGGAGNVDVVVNVDEGHIKISDESLASELTLSASDKKFAELVVEKVVDPQGSGGIFYDGSDEDIREMFERYTLALLSSVKHFCDIDDEERKESEVAYNIAEFHTSWVESWMKTKNHAIWKETVAKAKSDYAGGAFGSIEPRHVCHSPSIFSSIQRGYFSKFYSIKRNIIKGINRTQEEE